MSKSSYYPHLGVPRRELSVTEKVGQKDERLQFQALSFAPFKDLGLQLQHIALINPYLDDSCSLQISKPVSQTIRSYIFLINTSSSNDTMGWFWADTNVSVVDARSAHHSSGHGAQTGTPPVSSPSNQF